MPHPSSDRPLGVAVIGYAFMGKAHSQAWRNARAFFDTPAYEQKLLVGRDAEQAAAAAGRYGWQESTTDWRDVLSREDIDVVDICSPGYLHAEMAVAALEAGKHVLVEKPLANTVAEAEAMADAARRAAAHGVRSMVGFNYRRVPALALARELIAGGRLGTIRSVRSAYLQDWLADAESPMTWRLDKETAGSGALGDIASHLVDQIRFLLQDRVTAVSGRLHTYIPERPEAAAAGAPAEAPARKRQVTVDDAAWATLDLAGGAVASVEVSRVALGRKNSLQVEVFGDLGSLSFDLENLNELQFFDGTLPVRQQGFTRILATEPEHPYLSSWWPQGHVLGWEHSFVHEVADFLGCIRDGQAPSPSFDDGLAVQRVLAGVEESAAAGSALVPVDG
ncbi:Gfo/Idh/MocA family oxidoreductase [Arthrobacter sp. ATA002]|uniref:Gfo/Idh/MocA family protein n=1 Tax=Arthrobacter sp. ATA002 TaxID=2991715 RepID=UPI0022A7AC33|nr:Gfo/Idh/MocA family oxidoreductase [Arthrobacter sp. ATA002]WAP51762.1 Gfo/Idh/MocA family oxidoreductase [Arthrobacter sp. ATA002]